MHGFVLLFLVEQLETQRCTLLRGLRWRCDRWICGKSL